MKRMAAEGQSGETMPKRCASKLKLKLKFVYAEPIQKGTKNVYGCMVSQMPLKLQLANKNNNGVTNY